MAMLTYVCAPWTVRVIIAAASKPLQHRFFWLAGALFVMWLVVDGSYVAYNELMGHAVLRTANFFASSALYLLAGMLWSYRGSLRQLAGDVCHPLRRK
jgi:hypothetical protein